MKQFAGSKQLNQKFLPNGSLSERKQLLSQVFQKTNLFVPLIFWLTRNQHPPEAEPASAVQQISRRKYYTFINGRGQTRQFLLTLHYSEDEALLLLPSLDKKEKSQQTFPTFAHSHSCRCPLTFTVADGRA